MSVDSRKHRITFRPSIEGWRLEERVVLSSTNAAVAAALAQDAAALGTPMSQIAVASNAGGTGTSISQDSAVNAALARDAAARGTSTGQAAVASQTSVGSQAGVASMTVKQIRATYLQHLRSAQNALSAAIDNHITSLYTTAGNLDASGHLTAQAVANFKAQAGGSIDATALQLSTQAALLPGSSGLVSRLQKSLLGSQAGSLTSKIDRLADTSRFTRNQAVLQRAVNHVMNTELAAETTGLKRFFATTPLNRLSIDATTGQRVSLSQFLSTRAVSAINNTFGSLANSVGSNAKAALFDTAGNFNAKASTSFQQQYATALNTAAFQLGSVLSLFPGANTSVNPQLRSALFATGADPTTGQPSASLLNALTGTLPSTTGGTSTTPFTMNAFNTGFQGGFTTAFQNVSSPINSFFGVTPTGNVGTLPSGFFQTGATFPGTFGSTFTGSTFNNGFNNGFATNGSGFIGFGTAPTGFNTGFTTGFNGIVSAVNPLLGFTQPVIGTGVGIGVGTSNSGTGVSVGTGVGTPTTGLLGNGTTSGGTSGLLGGTTTGVIGPGTTGTTTGTLSGGTTTGTVSTGTTTGTMTGTIGTGTTTGTTTGGTLGTGSTLI